MDGYRITWLKCRILFLFVFTEVILNTQVISMSCTYNMFI
jgi:hypothetical protein